MTRFHGLVRLLAALAAVWAAPVATCAAHPPVSAVTALRISEQGELSLALTYDALAFALNDTSINIPDGPMFELLDGPEDALSRALERSRERFETLCVLTVDGVRVPVTVTTMPTPADVHDWRKARKSYPLPVKLELLARAELPPAGRSFQVRFPEVLGSLLLVVERPGEETAAIPLTPNELSPAFALPARAGSAPAPGTLQPADSGPGAWSTFERFAVLGFRHIIPEGLDHCLFVLGLFLLSPRVRPVLFQISAFTLAHTLTLTLTSLNIIGLPSHVVEPAIAASIAVVGIENLFTKRVDWKRSIVAFGFGLVHGMGVATAFNEAGFPEGRLIPSLAAFTVGVEAGHLAVLAGAFALLAWTRSRPWYRTRVAVPLSLAISLVALVWFVQRI